MIKEQNQTKNLQNDSNQALQKRNLPQENYPSLSDERYYNSNSQNKIDIRVGDQKRSMWVFQDKCSQKMTNQSIQSLEMDQNSILFMKNLEEKDKLAVANKHKICLHNIKQDSVISDNSNTNNESQIKQSETPTSKIYKGRNTIYRVKQDDSILESYSSIKKKTKKKSEVNQYENHHSENEQDHTLQNQVKNKPKKLWNTKFFKILLFVNRFLYRNKLKLIHFRPQNLLNHQVLAINDNAHSHCNDDDSKLAVKDNIFRSQYRIVRRLRIFYLISRKKLKLFITPLSVFQNKFLSLLRTVLDPIPVILPYYKFSLFWDFIIVFLILVNVIKIPFEIAFNEGEHTLRGVSTTSRLIFFIDFFMMFNTAYYESGILEKQRSKIFLHFLKNRLIIEVFAYLCLWLNPFGIPVFRIFFLVKFFSFYDTIEKLAEAFQLSFKYNFIVNLIALLIEVVFLCHLFACIWFSIGNYEQKNNIQPNWIQFYHFHHSSQFSSYIASQDFSVVTIGTIGYGDINPQNSIERAFISCLAIFSCGIFAYILSNIQNVYREYIQKQEVYLSKLGELNNYMINREVNPILQQMARKYLKYVHQQGYQQGVMPCETLNSLSKSLREDIKEDIFKKSLNSIPLFNSFSNELKQALSIKMIESNFGPDEIIMKSGQVQQPCLYYILKGSVEVCLDKQQNYGFQAANNYEAIPPFYVSSQNHIVGLYEFVSQSHQSMTNARSIGVTTVHSISLTDFLDVLNQFQQDKEIYFQFKDSINLYHQYGCVNAFCYSCKSSQHLIKDCPIFFYRPVKQRIINQYNTEFKKGFKEIIRSIKNNHRFNSLQIRNDVEHDVKEFCEENKSDIDSLYESMSESEDISELKKGAVQSIEDNLLPQSLKSEGNALKTQNPQQLNEEELKQFLEKQNANPMTQSKNDEQVNPSDLIILQKQQVRQIENAEITNLENHHHIHKKSIQNLGLYPQSRNTISHGHKHIQKSSISRRKSQQLFDMLLNQKMLYDLQNNQSPYHQQGSGGKYGKYQFSQTRISQQNISRQTILPNSEQKQQQQNQFSQIMNLFTLFDQKNVRHQHNKDILEELITDTMRTYKLYMSHNNIAIIIKQFNNFQQKKKQNIKSIQQKQIQNNILNRDSLFKSSQQNTSIIS